MSLIIDEASFQYVRIFSWLSCWQALELAHRDLARDLYRCLCNFLPVYFGLNGFDFDVAMSLVLCCVAVGF
jgi:hypothetical protein